MTELSVTPQHLQDLVVAQAAAASQLDKATSAINGIGHAMWINHGLVCAATNKAVVEAEHTRHAAASAVHAVSADLAVKLRSAANLYDSTDQLAAEDLRSDT